MTPAYRVFAPSRILTPLRATAAVAAIPPKKGMITFTAPCDINSRLLLCFVPVMPSQTTAHNNASIAPSKAIVKAEGRTFLTNSHEKPGTFTVGNPVGIVPTAGTFNARTTAKTVKTINATKEAGIFLVYLFLARK